MEEDIDKEESVSDKTNRSDVNDEDARWNETKVLQQLSMMTTTAT